MKEFTASEKKYKNNTRKCEKKNKISKFQNVRPKCSRKENLRPSFYVKISQQLENEIPS